MGDDEGRASAGGVGDGTLNFVLGGGVNRRSGVVQHQHARISEKGAGERDALALSARKGHTAFPDDGVVALIEAKNKFMRLCRDGCGNHFISGRAWLAEGDIVTQRAREQKDVLLDDGDLRTQRSQIPLAHVDPIYQHLTRSHIVGAVDQLDERSLARARLPDNGDSLSLLDFEGNILHNGFSLTPSPSPRNGRGVTK